MVDGWGLQIGAAFWILVAVGFAVCLLFAYKLGKEDMLDELIDGEEE